MAYTFRFASPEQTMRFSAGFSTRLMPGDVIVLTGELGSGKTYFVKGVARGLGIIETVTSPTFALLKTYRGRLALFHLDLYRIDSIDEMRDFGIEEYLPGDGVTLIEWGEKAKGILPDDAMVIEFTKGPGNEERQIVMRPGSRQWEKRLKGTTDADPWI